jgi:hypothetical protein
MSGTALSPRTPAHLLEAHQECKTLSDPCLDRDARPSHTGNAKFYQQPLQELLATAPQRTM